MRIFLGSSKEQVNAMMEVASWIENLGHDPLRWDKPSLFLPGEFTIQTLMSVSKQVDAAIFIFSEDDKGWYRTDLLEQPRDNILIEYGLFARSLGMNRSIICRKGEPKTPSDLIGITVVNLTKPQTAQMSIEAWLKSIEGQKAKTEKPNISGRWETELTEEGKKYNEIVELRQQGRKVFGEIILDDEGEKIVYIFTGTFENLILSGTFYSKDESNFEQGAIVLRYIKKGKFEGKSIFFSKMYAEKLVSSQYKWIFKGPIK